MITQQQFNQIYLGLQAQGWQKSYDDEIDQCMYRGPNGLKCAIGQLIPDDLYDPTFDDDATIYDLGSFQDLGLFQDMTGEEFCLLQNMHDTTYSPETMKRRFEEFAINRGLTIPAAPVRGIRHPISGAST